MIEVSHPKQYSAMVEDKIINQSSWKISNVPETMFISNNVNNFDNFYCIFFPVFSETSLNKNLEYRNYEIYLINHSKNKENISLSFSKTPKVIYFVNNSNSQLTINNNLIDLSDKKGKSLFVEKIDKIDLIRSSNIQTCLVILNLKNKININY